MCNPNKFIPSTRRRRPRATHIIFNTALGTCRDRLWSRQRYLQKLHYSPAEIGSRRRRREPIILHVLWCQSADCCCYMVHVLAGQATHHQHMCTTKPFNLDTTHWLTDWLADDCLYQYAAAHAALQRRIKRCCFSVGDWKSSRIVAMQVLEWLIPSINNNKSACPFT